MTFYSFLLTLLYSYPSNTFGWKFQGKLFWVKDKQNYVKNLLYRLLFTPNLDKGWEISIFWRNIGRPIHRKSNQRNVDPENVSETKKIEIERVNIIMLNV